MTAVGPLAHTRTARESRDETEHFWLAATMLGSAVVVLAVNAHEDVGQRQQTIQSARYGPPLGLPKDADKLYIPDAAYPRFPLPPGNEAYAHVDGLKMKAVMEQITAISRKSRDDGNQNWGRIPGTVYDRMTQDWVIDQFQKIGLEHVRRQELEMKDLWYPESWKASITIAGKTIELKTTFPINETVGTPPAGISAEAVWVGLGTAADLKGRNIKDNAIFIYSFPTPGGRDHSADWNGAMRRAHEGGAALVFIIMGFPGNALSNPEGARGTRAPPLTISPDEGNAIREALEKGETVTVHMTADIKERHGLKTANVWGVLP